MLWFTSACCSYAQNESPYSIRGIISDSATNKAIEFATIAILDSSGKVVALTYSDENGIFKSKDVHSGLYSLNLSFIGYRQKNTLFQISQDKPVINFGTIRLNPEAAQLNTVTITGSRQLIEQQPGMLIYNAEKDISNNGGTAADVLRKAPVLNVDAAGNVTMRGSSNLRILINGKYSGQMARSPADALNMMPANSIKSIEVITSPSARYDAEGAAGVINIITKKGQQSVSGTVEVVAGNLEQALNPRIAINREKWNVRSNLHLHRLRSKEATSLNRVTFENGEQTGKILQSITKNNVKPHGSGDLQIEFTPDSTNLFNFSLNGWLGNWPENSEQHNQRYSASNVLLEEYHQSVKTKAPNLGLDFNLGYTRKFKKPGEELYLMAQHNRSTDDYDYNAGQKDPDHLLIYRELNSNSNSNHEWTFQGDYILPFGKPSRHALESGAKAILRNNSSHYRVEASSNSDPETLILLDGRSDVFEYTQNVIAAYSQVKLKWNNGWTIHAGARMEGTFLEGKQQKAGADFSNHFWNFVPSATAFKKLNANNNLTISYTQRISRPSIWDLNPNIDSQDPKNIVVGNPALRPERVNQVEFTYALQTDSDLFMNFSLFGRKTNNSIESIVSTDSTGISTTNKKNLASNTQLGINFSTSFNVLPGWKINSNANVRHGRFQSSLLDINTDGMAWGINVNSSWKLRKNFSIQAYSDYDARSIMLQGNEGSWWYYSFSAKKDLPVKKLTISLTIVNPFLSATSQTVVTRSSDFHSSLRTDYFNRSVRLSLNWEFGGMFKDGERRAISNDDVKNNKSAK